MVSEHGAGNGLKVATCRGFEVFNGNEQRRGVHERYTDTLSDAELVVCDFISRGLSEKEAAELLCKSKDTIHTQKKSIYRKLGVSKDTEMIWWFVCVALGIEFDLLDLRQRGIFEIIHDELRPSTRKLDNA